MKKEMYVKTQLVITEFGKDGIYTDPFASGESTLGANALPTITLGNPISGIAGTDITGQRDPINTNP